jgi:hypothetical protein
MPCSTSSSVETALTGPDHSHDPVAHETVGYRRLFDAAGCSLAQGDELRLRFPLGSPIQAEVYLGPKPRFGVTVTSGEEFIIPDGQSACICKIDHQGDASKSSYPRHFFTEICCSLEVETPEELSAAFRQQDPNANDPVLNLVAARAKELKNAADLVAGVIGLRFHRQFVIKVVCEDFYALRPDDYALQAYGPAAEVLEAISLNESGRKSLPQLLEACGAADPAEQAFAGSVLHWLLRAWTERDAITRFVALFVPLEMILDGSSRPPAPEWQTLRELVTAHGGEQCLDLLAFLDRRRSVDRPSLNDRFEILARASGHPRWETDVQAFRRFNHLRNDLLHRGEPAVRFHITVGENEAHEMGDLAERYVSRRLFGDMRVYQSRFRVPQPITPA